MNRPSTGDGLAGRGVGGAVNSPVGAIDEIDVKGHGNQGRIINRPKSPSVRLLYPDVTGDHPGTAVISVGSAAGGIKGNCDGSQSAAEIERQHAAINCLGGKKIGWILNLGHREKFVPGVLWKIKVVGRGRGDFDAKRVRAPGAEVGRREVQRVGEKVELGQWQRANVRSGSPISTSDVLAPPDLAQPLNLAPIITQVPKTTPVHFPNYSSGKHRETRKAGRREEREKGYKKK